MRENKTIGKSKLIGKIASNTGIDQSLCETIVEEYISEIIKSLVNGDKIVFKNFMSFEVIERAERESVDFKTCEPVIYPPVKSVKCKIAKAVKDAVNGKLVVDFEQDDC